MAFNADLFRKKNQENTENNPFGEIDNGIYILELTKSEMNFAKNSGRYQAMFQWKVDPEQNDRFKGQNVFVFCGLKDKDGNDDEKGYGAFDIILRTLGVNDTLAFISDVDNNMLKLEGTRVRMKIEDNKKNPQFKQYRVERLIRNVWKEKQGIPSQNHSQPVEPQQTNSNSNAAYYDNKPFTNVNGIEIKQGQKVTARLKDGSYLGEILSVVQQMNQALVQFENTNIQTQLVSFDDLFVWQAQTKPAEVQTIETIEEVSPPGKTKLELNMNVTGKWGDQTITGIVYEIDEAKQIVKINQGGKGYACPADTVQLIV